MINTLYQDVLQDRLTVLPGEPVPAGKLLIAVYDVGKEKPRLSPNEAVEDGYHGIPAVKLASGLSDAQTLILLYPTERSVRFQETLIGKGELWENIMDYWRYANTDLIVHTE